MMGFYGSNPLQTMLGTFLRKHKAYTVFQSQLYKDIFRKIGLSFSLDEVGLNSFATDSYLVAS